MSFIGLSLGDNVSRCISLFIKSENENRRVATLLIAGASCTNIMRVPPCVNSCYLADTLLLNFKQSGILALACYFFLPPPPFHPRPPNYLFYPFRGLYLPIPTHHVIFEFSERFSFTFIISPCFVFRNRLYPFRLFLCSKANVRLQFKYGARPTLPLPPPRQSRYLQVRVAPHAPTNRNLLELTRSNH